MACYTLRYLARKDGTFRALSEIQAKDRHEALRIAARLIGRRPAELWEGGTMLHRVEGVRIGLPY